MYHYSAQTVPSRKRVRQNRRHLNTAIELLEDRSLLTTFIQFNPQSFINLDHYDTYIVSGSVNTTIQQNVYPFVQELLLVKVPHPSRLTISLGSGTDPDLSVSTPNTGPKLNTQYNDGSLVINYTGSANYFSGIIIDWALAAGTLPHDASFRIYLNFESTISVPPPEIAMNSAAITPNGQNVSASYTISGSPLPSAGTIDFFWASGPSTADELGSPYKVSVETGIGTYTAKALILKLGPQPANASYILAVADSPNADPAHRFAYVTAPLGDVGLDSANISYFTSNTSSTITFTYHTINNPGTFTAALYQSADLGFDSSDHLVTKKDIAASANSSGVNTLTINFTPLPQQPYLLVVINPQTFVAQSNGNVHELPAYLVSLAQLQAIMPKLGQSDAERYIGPLNEALEEFQINTPKREAAFLAQVAVESYDLIGLPNQQPDVQPWEEGWDKKTQFIIDGEIVTATTKEEFFNYKYGPDTTAGARVGNTELGDGFKYRGRGPIQITGRENYQKIGNKLTIDLIDNPDLLYDRIGRPDVGFRASAYFFSQYKKLALSTPAGKALVARSSIPRSILSGTMLGIADFVDVNSIQSVQDVNDALTYGVNGGSAAIRFRLEKYKLALRVFGFQGAGTL